MTECSIPMERYFTACASLAALGVQRHRIWTCLVRFERPCALRKRRSSMRPVTSSTMPLSARLSGAGGLVEINSRERRRSREASSVWTRPLCRAVGGATDAGRL